MRDHHFYRSLRNIGALFLLIFLAPACDSSRTDEETVIRPGYLVFTDKVSEITILNGPARVGRPVTASFVTWGSASCEEPYSDEVAVNGLNAVITTMDKTYVRPCAYVLNSLPHVVRLTFDEPGEARITAKGWLWRNGLDGLSGEDHEITLDITVTD